MPYEDDEARRAARERLQARMARRGSSSTLASNTASRRSQREEQWDQPDGAGGTGSAGRRRNRQPKPVSTSGRQPQLYTPKKTTSRLEIGPFSFDIPSSIPPMAIPIAAAVIVLLLIFAVIVPNCSRSSQASGSAQSVSAEAASSQASATTSDSAGAASTAASATTTPSATSTSSQAGAVQQVVAAKNDAQRAVQNASSVESVDKQDNTQAALVELLGEETSAKLLAQAKTSTQALWIAAHPSAFSIDGVEVQYKVMKLAADEPASLDYVRDFPESYPAEKASEDKSVAMSTSSPSSGVPDTDIPHFYQWDRRWGYTTYSGAAFGLTGCGPTSLAMVYQGLTGKTDKNPYDMGKYADEMGYMSEYEGTVGSFFTETAEDLGLSCEEIYPDAENIRQAVEHGQTVIANLAPGYFTVTGHYFVITGLTDNGEAIINDPYSVERSGQTWDLDLIASQSYVCYGYTKA